MEEIDMDMSRIYDAMDEGVDSLKKEDEINSIEINKKATFELILKDKLIKLIDEPLLPFIEPKGFHFPLNKPYSKILDDTDEDAGGWFDIRIPDFSLIRLHINLVGRKRYAIYDPKSLELGEEVFDDLDAILIHKHIADYRIALALAKQSWEYYLKTTKRAVELAAGAGVPDPKAEVYESVEVEGYPIDQARENYIFSLIDKQLKHYGLI